MYDIFSGEMYDIGWGQKLFMSCKGKGAPTGRVFY